MSLDPKYDDGTVGVSHVGRCPSGLNGFPWLVGQPLKWAQKREPLGSLVVSACWMRYLTYPAMTFSMDLASFLPSSTLVFCAM